LVLVDNAGLLVDNAGLHTVLAGTMLGSNGLHSAIHTHAHAQGNAASLAGLDAVTVAGRGSGQRLNWCRRIVTFSESVQAFWTIAKGVKVVTSISLIRCSQLLGTS
jgi:hypothetical protein